MYPWIWRHLPSPFPLRLVTALVLVAGVVAVLFAVVFPWAEHTLPFLHVTVNE
jgi:hypothetical protein